MKFSTQPVAAANKAVFDFLTAQLTTGKKVLWLTSGGSCIAPQVDIMERLRQASPSVLPALTILPVDERYGSKGHKHSNTAQMRTAGFDSYTAAWHDVLKRNEPVQETVSYYSELVSDTRAVADVVVATLGMGADGHTAGVLPGSPAVTDTVSTVVGYSWSDYERMTLGISTLLKIDHVWLLAYGEGKKQALERLHANSEPIEKLPAKILYDIANVTVYNDYITTEE